MNNQKWVTERTIYIATFVISSLIFSFVYFNRQTLDPDIQSLLINISSELAVLAVFALIVRFVIKWRPEDEFQERQNTLLNRVSIVLQELLDSYSLGVRYLETKVDTDKALEVLASKADNFINSIGAKSDNPKYFSLIEHAVLKKQIVHRRLINSDHIPHRLHLHLNKLLSSIGKSGFELYWINEEKIASVSVSEKMAVIVFPATSRDKYSGLKLPGVENSQRYKLYFSESISSALPITSPDGLESLCIECSNIAKNAKEIKKKLLGELKKAPI